MPRTPFLATYLPRRQCGTNSKSNVPHLRPTCAAKQSPTTTTGPSQVNKSKIHFPLFVIFWRVRASHNLMEHEIPLHLVGPINCLSSNPLGMTGEVRGCAPAENAYEVPNRIGCGRDDGADRTVFCLCGTDLCNGASRLSAHVLPWSMTKLTLPLALLMLNFLILRTFSYSWRPQRNKSHFCGFSLFLFVLTW